MKLGRSMFVRLAVTSIAFFLLAMSILSALLIRQAYLREYESGISRYDSRLNILSGSFTEKLSNFPSTLSSIFSTGDNVSLIYEALEAQTDSDALKYKTGLSAMFESLISGDYSICGVILDSFITNNYFALGITGSGITFQKKNADAPEPALYKRELLSVEEIALTYPSYPAGNFAISAFLGAKGRLLVFYSSSGLNTLMSADSLNACFEIKNENELTVYSYGKPINSNDVIQSSVSSARFRFTASYTIDSDVFRSGFNTGYNLLILLIFFVSALIILMYVLTLNLFRKRINAVSNGLKKISETDFDYRIPKEKISTEFGYIAEEINSMAAALRQNIDLRYTYMLKQKNAELYALQTSINPHFLCNMLETIRAETAVGKTKNAQDMLVLLSRIYRSILRRETFSTLLDELDLCGALNELYQIRYQNFEYEQNIDSCLYGCALPTGTLQPIIENYFEHGLDLSRNDNFISVNATLDGEKITFTILNNGLPITDEALEALIKRINGLDVSSTQKGFGLKNVNDRLKIVFGEENGITVSRPNNNGFAVKFCIPFVKPDELMLKYNQLIGGEDLNE